MTDNRFDVSGNRLPSVPDGFRLHSCEHWLESDGDLIVSSIEDLMGRDICVAAICFMLDGGKSSVEWMSSHTSCYRSCQSSLDVIEMYKYRRRSP